MTPEGVVEHVVVVVVGAVFGGAYALDVVVVAGATVGVVVTGAEFDVPSSD
ncbi:MAG TPA: hypothetical protein VII65_05530 [Acidimicrobiales bacterium]